MVILMMTFIDASTSSSQLCIPLNKAGNIKLFRRHSRSLETKCSMSVPGISPAGKESETLIYIRDDKTVPYAPPPSVKDIDLLYQFFDRR